jgi:MerR family transcriptional regulator, heat shock protein HspR
VGAGLRPDRKRDGLARSPSAVIIVPRFGCVSSSGRCDHGRRRAGKDHMMGELYYYRRQVIEIFECEHDFLNELEREELIRPVQVESIPEQVYTPEQVERIRIIRNLTHDLDVNLAGVEVIMAMRENMIQMQGQFYEILESLVRELKTRMPS